MEINLIPVCRPGVSYGEKILEEAISRFREQLLAVIVVCPEEGFEFDGDEPAPNNITRADITAAICLFREIGTIGQVTGFIHENGMNINLSGTGGSFGENFMVYLTQLNIKPWFYPSESAYELMAKWSGKPDNFRIKYLPVRERLPYWKMFLVDEVAPRLYTEYLGLFVGSRTGTWQSSWRASDISTEYVDETQLDAILDNADFFSTFLDEIASSRILGQIDVNAAKARKTLKQQIYIGAITCFETYLSDAFINTVLSKDEYIRAFFSSFKDFKSQKFGVDELFTYVDRYEEIAKKAMMDVIYHNLPKVSHMYKEALDISFPDFSGIQSDIATRHDLVHRNGKTKEGKAIVVDQLLVDQVILRVESFVKEIDQQLKAKEAVA